MNERDPCVNMREVLAEANAHASDTIDSAIDRAAAPYLVLSMYNSRPCHMKQAFISYVIEQVSKDEAVIAHNYDPRIAAQARVEHAAERLCTDDGGHTDLQAVRSMLEPWQLIFDETKQLFETFGTP